MTEPLKLACPECGYASAIPDDFATHMVGTGHAMSDEMRQDILSGRGSYADLLASIQGLYDMVTTGIVPPNAELRPVDIEEELADPDVPDEAKQHIRDFTAQIDALEKKKQP